MQDIELCFEKAPHLLHHLQASVDYEKHLYILVND